MPPWHLANSQPELLKKKPVIIYYQVLFRYCRTLFQRISLFLFYYFFFLQYVGDLGDDVIDGAKVGFGNDFRNLWFFIVG